MLVKGAKAGFSRDEAAEYMKGNRTRAEHVATQVGSDQHIAVNTNANPA